MATIAYVGHMTVPSSHADALRVKGVAEALAMAGHQVHICGVGASTDERDQWPMQPAIHLHVAREYESGLGSRLPRGVRGLLLGDMTIRWLQTLRPRPDVVIQYGTHVGYFLRLRRLTRQWRIPLILDVVEWYDPRHLPGGLLGPFALSHEISMRVLAHRADAFLPVSRYLEQHFAQRGGYTLRLPPLFSTSPPGPARLPQAGERLTLCYVGSPGKKDDIRSVLCGVVLARRRGAPVALHVVGPSRETCVANVSPLQVDLVDETVTFHGRLPHRDAKTITSASDFLVLLRRPGRVALAGFPSKAAESLRAGTPLMTNLSSNLDEVVTDGRDAIVVGAATAQALCHAILRAASLTRCQLLDMQDQARRTGARWFDPEAYRDRLATFITEVRERTRAR